MLCIVIVIQLSLILLLKGQIAHPWFIHLNYIGLVGEC